MDLLIAIPASFLAGVGVGTFVLGARIRTILAEAILYTRKEDAKVDAAVDTKIAEVKKVL